jgi:hypothetical protein
VLAIDAVFEDNEFDAVPNKDPVNPPYPIVPLDTLSDPVITVDVNINTAIQFSYYTYEYSTN